MVDEVITKQELIDAQKDAQSLDDFINGGDEQIVVTRLLKEYPTLANAIRQIYEKGGKFYPTLADANADIANIRTDVYVITGDNGAYYKSTAGATSLTKSPYDPLTQAKADATTKANAAQAAAITAAQADATTKANAAKTDAIATAATDATTKANAAEANAKTYADNLPLLVNDVVASNDKSEKLIGLIAGTFYTTPANLMIILPSDNAKFIYLFEAKPNTTYTVCVKSVYNPIIREFDNKPDTKQGTTIAQAGSVLTTTYAGVNMRYATFTTGSTTKWIALDPANYSNYEWLICEGTYAATMWNSFVVESHDKPIIADLITAKKIKSDMIVQSKNLFEGYNFGSRLSDTVAVGVETANIVSTGATLTAANYKQYVGAYFKVQPNTTYTFSKEQSNRFHLVLLKANRTTGKLLVRDSALRQYTFTTEVDTAFVFVYLSSNYEQPRVQLELGSKVTAYEEQGQKFIEQAKPLGKLLTEDTKQTDNQYLTLGLQSDKFYYKNQSGGVNVADVIDTFYEPLLALYPGQVSKNLLGKDASNTYDIYEYIFEPDNYEQKIIITAGMHPTELVTMFALGSLLNEAYRNPNKHEGLAYLRNKVKIVVIPVVNPWGMNQNPKTLPTHYLNANGINPARNFPERWDLILPGAPGDYGSKGVTPLDQAEAQHMYTVLNREKDGASFYFDLHTGQGTVRDSFMYWQEDDYFLRPVLQNIVSMRNDIIRTTLGREPVNETFETQRATSTYQAWRVFNIPTATIEYGAVQAENLSTKQMTDYVDLIFNCIHYALKANLRKQLTQAELNEHNKQFISLYSKLTAHNDVVNHTWNYAQLQANLYEKLALTKSVLGAASGSYSLVNYIHAPVGYKNTVVLSAGLRGRNTRKSVTELGFFAHKLMTDKNPHIVALRNSTRFIFIPCLNPHGYDNNIVNNANAVQPYLNFATSTQPESVALRAFIDAETIDLFVDIDSLLNADKPSGYANLQVIHNATADIEYGSIFSVLNAKYSVNNPANAVDYSTALVKSQIADYINGKGVAYTYSFFAQNVLPKRTTVGENYEDLGYESKELNYCTEVLLNSIKEICKRKTLSKYLAN